MGGPSVTILCCFQIVLIWGERCLNLTSSFVEIFKESAFLIENDSLSTSIRDTTVEGRFKLNSQGKILFTFLPVPVKKSMLSVLHLAFKFFVADESRIYLRPSFFHGLFPLGRNDTLQGVNNLFIFSLKWKH